MHATNQERRFDSLTTDDIEKAVVGINFPADKAELVAYVARRVAPR